MDRYDLFDKLFVEHNYVIEHNGKKYRKEVSENKIDFCDPDTDEPVVTVEDGKVFCSECGVELGYDDCELINYKTLNLICPECFYEYQVIFPTVKQVNMSKDIKSITENSIYIAKVGNETKHVVFKNNKFLSIEDDDQEAKPDLLLQEVFLSNAEIAKLRKV